MLAARVAARLLLLKAVFDIFFTSPIVGGVDRVEVWVPALLPLANGTHKTTNSPHQALPSA
jgi:hypothetical protein